VAVVLDRIHKVRVAHDGHGHARGGERLYHAGDSMRLGVPVVAADIRQFARHWRNLSRGKVRDVLPVAHDSTSVVRVYVAGTSPSGPRRVSTSPVAP
jgi:hypothetical protein